MIKYILAENLKYKRTFLKKLPVIAPSITVLSAFFLMPLYFSSCAYNWWYVILMPATFSLIPSMMQNYEKKKSLCMAIYSLDVSLKSVWFAKVLVAIYYVTITAFLHMLLVYMGQILLHKQLSPTYNINVLILATLVLIITSIWQIPLCLFLAKKFGFIVSITGNAIIGVIVGILFADGKYSFLCPYSWGMKAMISILKILPNGTMAESQDIHMLYSSIIPSILSIALCIFFSLISATWFSKQEAK